MIQWYEHLYLDDRAKKNIEKITDKVERGKEIWNLYLIVQPSNKANLFDIISASEITQDHYKRNDLFIMGAAYGKDSAIEEIMKMMQEVDANTSDFDVRAYFGIEAV
ncbi:hypothetical protein lbkm_0730 [Lachnospiraceae bacterium KM106-2]|nr:hypothetical protein lbkm_0730 [Lachnospiraceae bacterium KM106-2]